LPFHPQTMFEDVDYGIPQQQTEAGNEPQNVSGLTNETTNQEQQTTNSKPASPQQQQGGQQTTNPQPQKTVKPKTGIISSTQLKNMDFTMFGFEGEWNDHLGKVMTPFSMMVHGAPGSGKSTYCIKLAHYCASQINKNVLYVGAEEGFNATMKDKFDRLDAYHENLHLTGEMPDKFDKNYDIIFLDSVHVLEIDPVRLTEIVEEMKLQNTSLVFIFHSTKAGQYRGATTNEHLIDISVKLENGATTFSKNRFGGFGVMYVF
jgi:predicted ATP-dependent serine protease